MPPRESLGWFTRPGDCEAISDWLRKAPSGRLVVSTDMLCYGGLIASRSPAVGLEQAMGRLETLRHLRRERPDLAIFAFGLITRIGTTVAAADDLEVHELLRSYSQLLDRVERVGNQEEQAELEAVVQRLDPDVLAKYLAVRRRNHAINRATVRLVADGIVDYLVIAQEDAAPFGIHIPEQLVLRDEVEEFRVADRVAIHPGADEVALVLMVRQCLATERSVGITVDYATEAGADAVPQFENHSLRDSVASQIAAAGAHLAPPGEADAVLFVHTPLGQQGNITAAPPLGEAPSLALQAESVSERVQAASAAGRLVGLADVAYCNGCDPELIAALGRIGAARGLDAFAGWNTAGNTIGTVVAQLCLRAVSGVSTDSPTPAASARFLACRFIDDYAYQSQVRQRAIAHAEGMGADPHALGTAWSESERYVSAELEPLAHVIYSDLLAERPDDSLGDVSASLPWRRLFEVEVDVSR